MRSGEMLPMSDVRGRELCLEGERDGFGKRWDVLLTGCEPREGPLRLEGLVAFFLMEDFERVIGMAESLYCLYRIFITIPNEPG